MGYNWKYKGTNYLMEAILFIYTSNNIDLVDNLEKNVYKYIAYKNNKNVNNIKTNIIKSTEKLINQKQNTIDTVTPKQAINAKLNKILINYKKQKTGQYEPFSKSLYAYTKSPEHSILSEI